LKLKKQGIMKQPELGQKILKLRKQKGFTQEELVAQCNINVRTIQRIEAGEVNPRSYTVKIILEVLGADYFEEEQKDEVVFTAKEKRSLQIAWISGVVYFLIGFVETASDFYQFTDDTSLLNTFIYAVIKIISAVSFVFFFAGFYAIATRYKSQLLKVITILLMATFVISNCVAVFTLHVVDETFAVRVVVEAVVFGVLQLVFGIGILQLHRKLGPLAQVSGILEVIVGVCFGTVIFAYLGLFLLIPAVILETLLRYKLSKKESITHDDRAHSLIL
jgi:transcriptional regulator with XRE-family HTH domain